MSRFSSFVHEHFGTGAPNETAADIIVRHIPDTGELGTVKEVASDVVAVMEGTGLSGEEKKKLATKAVAFALAAAHVSVPASIVSFIIEEAVVLLKGGKASAAPPAPTPVPDPYAVPYPTALEAIGAGKPGDKVYDSHDGHFRLVYGGAGFSIPSTWTLVETIGG